MRLLIISDDSLPYSTLVHAKMLHELAKELQFQGHNPIILAPSDQGQTDCLIVKAIDGVEYWKFKSPTLRGNGKIKRAINESLLSTRAWFAIKNNFNKNYFDGVIYYSPSIFFGRLVKKIKSKSNCKSYLILRDDFPQWAVDEGLIKNGSLIEKYFVYHEKVNYQAADSIGLMSPKNLEMFNEKYNRAFKAHVLYNWADINPPQHSHFSFDLRVSLGLKNKIIYFYGGNVGHAQDMGNLLRLAEAMLEAKHVHFIILGNGDEVDLVKSTIKDKCLINTSFMDSVSQDKYKEILAQVDVGLFSLSANHKAHNFPGKLLGYMAQSLPILGSVNQGNDLIDVVRNSGAGYIFENGDDNSLFSGAMKLANSKYLRKNYGSKSNNLLIDNFSVNSAVETILSEIK